MKFSLALCLLSLVAAVHGEQCTSPSDCAHTTCDVNHGWFIHCTQGQCACTHDTYTGGACPGGQTSECITLHGNRCNNIGGAFHCMDNVCHCLKHNVDVGK